MINRTMLRILSAALLFAGGMLVATIASAQTGKSFAQKVVEEIKSAHPEITGLEVAATKPGTPCQTIAATEANEVGQKCDKDELTARRTNKPFVEKEKTEYDVTLPLHDPSGKIIATAGMDFKLEAGRTKESVVQEALKIAAELEKRLPSLDALFLPAN
jgi:hypothetical protein